MSTKKWLLLAVLFGLEPFIDAANTKEQTPQVVTLTDPVIDTTDGVEGCIDKTKISQTMWLIKEIKQVQNGLYRVNKNGEPDPSRDTTVKEMLFKGKKQTFKSLIELESKLDTLTLEDRTEFNTLFHTVKDYFDKVNQVLAPEARGTHAFMSRLTADWSRKTNRSDTLLLNWNKGDEIELFRRSVTNFKIFHTFSSDLANFLQSLIKSCPKAFNAYKKSRPAAQRSYKIQGA